jgi:hypothetical protein
MLPTLDTYNLVICFDNSKNENADIASYISDFNNECNNICFIDNNLINYKFKIIIMNIEKKFK